MIDSAPVPLIRLDGIHDEIREELDRAWSAITADNAYILGSAVSEFEASWAEYCGTREAIGVGNGTEAIELIVRGLRITEGSEVVVPASTFVATAAAVLAAGATPVFCDVDPESLLMTADQVSPVITSRTAAILPVHLYGAPADMMGLRALADARGLALIEDGAQAHGASSDAGRVGGLGDAAAFSHYPTKNLGAFGDGGSITTNDSELAGRIRLLRNHGRATQGDEVYRIPGRTGRLDALQAAILSVKLRHLDRWNEQRRMITGWYDVHLPTGVRRVQRSDSATPAPHLCVVRVANRDLVRAAMADRGVATGIHYPDPVPRTPAFGARLGFPVAEAAADSVISLPLWPGMTEATVERVCGVLAECERS